MSLPLFRLKNKLNTEYVWKGIRALRSSSQKQNKVMFLRQNDELFL